MILEFRECYYVIGVKKISAKRRKGKKGRNPTKKSNFKSENGVNKSVS